MEWLYHDPQSGRRRLKRRVQWALWAGAIGFGTGFVFARLLA
jgi:hypothetical protein